MQIRDVQLLDEDGAIVTTGSGDLATRELRFTVDGATEGDVFRVEVLPDPTFGPPKEIAQIVAGVFEGRGPQTMVAPLEGIARREYDISIYRVDRTTAGRDPNADAPLVWRQTISVR